MGAGTLPADDFLYPRQRRAMKERLFVLQGGRCCYCGCAVELYPKGGGLGRPAPKHLGTLEHLRRKADGGSNHPDNLALSCHDCNGRRGAMNWVEFKTLMCGVAA
jgi:hypothetical protein